MSTMEAYLEELRQLETAIRNSAAPAPDHLHIEPHNPGGNRKGSYYRLRADKGKKCPNGKGFQYLGRSTGNNYLLWSARMRSRDAIAEITKRAEIVRTWLANPITVPQQPIEEEKS